MRIIIIGAVAAGTSAAAKARRNNEEAEIIVYDKDHFISYSGCGMPYYIGDEIESADELTPRDPLFFKSKYNVIINTMHEVLSIHPDNKSLEIKNLKTQETFYDNYDKLIIATGATPVKPPINGIDSKKVFTLRNITDMTYIKEYITENNPKTATIIGTGFIGLEVCENLVKLGMSVTLIERLPHVTPGLDMDMSIYVKNELEKHGVTVFTDIAASEITEDSVILSNGKEIPTDFILLSTGVRPNTELAKNAGIQLGETGAIKVDVSMKTNSNDIYSCGDCSEQYHLVTEKPIYRPLGSTANKTGRIAGDSVTGGTLRFRGILGTGIFKIFDMTVALTGLSEREAREEGFDIVICHNIKPNKPEYMGGKEMVIKGIADKVTRRLLGVQIVGYEGVDKRIDIFATAITFKAKVEDLFHLDLAYAPPFSTTKDPVMYTGMILDNAINQGRRLITAKELDNLIQSNKNYVLIDARVTSQFEKAHVPTASNIPHVKLRDAIVDLDPNTIAVTYCNKGVTGNAAQNILINNGFTEVYNLSGGHKHFSKTQKQL